MNKKILEWLLFNVAPWMMVAVCCGMFALLFKALYMVIFVL